MIAWQCRIPNMGRCILDCQLWQLFLSMWEMLLQNRSVWESRGLKVLIHNCAMVLLCSFLVLVFGMVDMKLNNTKHYDVNLSSSTYTMSLSQPFQNHVTSPGQEAGTFVSLCKTLITSSWLPPVGNSTPCRPSCRCWCQIDTFQNRCPLESCHC